jgi:hypothetical protein
MSDEQQIRTLIQAWAAADTATATDPAAWS